jgi:hypothetical protein
MKKLIQRVAVERAGGKRPSAVRAVVTAAAVGVAAGSITYRALRT